MLLRVDDTPVHKAMREALANALIHANYYDRRGLVIHRRPQIITIANPGAFRISILDAVSGLSDPRNYTLVKLLNLIGIGERAGSGIPNIYAVWKKQGWKAPVLEERFNPDRTILSLVLSKTSDKKRAINTSDKKRTPKSNDRKQSIIEYLDIHKSGKTGEIASYVGISPGRARVYLQELVTDGLIVAEGSNRNKTYQSK